MGVSWTEIAEDYEKNGCDLQPVMFDYAVEPPAPLRPVGGTSADVWLRVGEFSYGPFRNPGYSVARSACGVPPEMPEGAEVRYCAKLKMGGPATPVTALLSTPVIDDVTIFFERGGPEILGYVGRGGLE